MAHSASSNLLISDTDLIDQLPIKNIMIAKGFLAAQRVSVSTVP